MTAAEIRDLVERMQGIVAILQSATTEDQRRVYEAAQLSITYDHAGKERNSTHLRIRRSGVPYVSEGELNPHDSSCEDERRVIDVEEAHEWVSWMDE